MSDNLPDPEVTRLLHRASLPRDLGTSLSQSRRRVTTIRGVIWRCAYRALSARECLRRPRRPRIEWVRMDWQTCGRTHESMKWVVLTRRSPHLTQLGPPRLFASLVSLSSRTHARLSFTSYPTLFSIVFLFSVSSVFFLPFLLSHVFSSSTFFSATRVSYSSPCSLPSSFPLHTTHNIHR